MFLKFGLTTFSWLGLKVSGKAGGQAVYSAIGEKYGGLFQGVSHIINLLRKYPEDLQFPNEIRKPNPKKRQGIQTAYRCNARPFS